MIPDLVHFIFGLESDFGDKPFSMVHYLAIRSAREVLRPRDINFFYRHEPSGFWWDLARELVILRPVDPPRLIFGRPLIHVAHQADVLRLQVLIEEGGIYLDIDTICRKPLDGLHDYPFVIGAQGDTQDLPGAGGLCNAVMMAPPGAPFARIWLETFSTFRSRGFDQFWDEHAVQVPARLAAEHPDLVHVEPCRSFHIPSWAGLPLLFEEVHDFPEAYVHHLWETVSWKPYLESLSVSQVLHIDTTYNLLARMYL